jgi:hypothetical protein
MNDDYAQIPVHGRHLGWAQSSLSQMGVPFSLGGRNGSVYIIIVPMPMAPMVQQQPWAYSPPPLTRQIPFVQIAVAILILVGAWMLFQAAPMLLATFAPDSAAVAQDAEDAPGVPDANILAVVTDAIEGVAAIPDKVNAEVNRRVDEVKQDISEAIMSTVLLTCGTPLLIALAIVALILVFRMVKR